jgi:hypothetical protein
MLTQKGEPDPRTALDHAIGLRDAYEQAVAFLMSRVSNTAENQ